MWEFRVESAVSAAETLLDSVICAGSVPVIPQQITAAHTAARMRFFFIF
jgi:hypothetical protein